MKQMKARLTVDFQWSRVDGGDIPESHVEALEESAWARVTEMAEEGYSSGELNDHIRITDNDPEDGVHYRGWWTLIGSQPQKDLRVLVVVSGGIADSVSDTGIDVEVFDWDDYNDDPEGYGGVPESFRDLADPINVPVGPEED